MMVLISFITILLFFISVLDFSWSGPMGYRPGGGGSSGNMGVVR